MSALFLQQTVGKRVKKRFTRFFSASSERWWRSLPLSSASELSSPSAKKPTAIWFKGRAPFSRAGGIRSRY